MEIAALLDFKTHETMVKLMLKEYHRDPLPGYAKVSVPQLMRYDKEVFKRLAEETRSGLELTSAGDMPLDLLLPRVMAEPRIAALLVPLPLTTVAVLGETIKRPRPEDKGRESDPKWQKNDKGKGGKGQHEKGDGKGQDDKGGGKKGGGRRGNKERTTRLPAELRGLSATYKGKNLCFDYNMKHGCDRNVDPMGTCANGFHYCMNPGCGGNHPAHYEGCSKKKKA